MYIYGNKNIKMSFTDIQLSILNGALLGDGCLYLGKRNKNACFTYNSSQKEHVEFVSNFIKEFCSSGKYKIIKTETFDKRTNKTYVGYRFRT